MKKYFYWVMTIGWALLIWRLTTTPDFSVTDDTVLSFLISNGGHFIFFGILAVFINLSLFNLRYSIALTSLYGLLIELVQRSIPGRSADLMDLLLDTLGAITFLAIARKISNFKS